MPESCAQIRPRGGSNERHHGRHQEQREQPPDRRQGETFGAQPPLLHRTFSSPVEALKPAAASRRWPASDTMSFTHAAASSRWGAVATIAMGYSALTLMSWGISSTLTPAAAAPMSVR